VERDLFDFEARVFLHNTDFLNGFTMSHWSSSEGNIEVIEGKDTQNLKQTIEFYKMRIAEMKENFPEVFEETRLHKIERDVKGRSWKVFTEPSVGRRPPEVSFEEAMELDLLRAIRKDKQIKDS